MPDWIDDIENAKEARVPLGVIEPQDPRQKMIADIQRVLTNHISKKECADDVHPYIGMMVISHEGKDDTNQASDCKSEAIVVVQSALSRYNVIIPLAEVGADSICFVSQSSPAGRHLLANAKRIQREIRTAGGSMLSYAISTDRGSVNVAWNITALYPPGEVREIILQNLHRVEVGSF